MNDLDTLWEIQRAYNQRLEKLCPDRTDAKRWTEILLLGLQSEITEVLREIGWKRHRGSQVSQHIPMNNLALELADITKYVVSLWDAWGFSADEMLEHTLAKSVIMAQRLEQEFHPLPPKNSKVLVVDLDGTLADLRYGLWLFLAPEKKYRVTTLYPDVDLGISYPDFQKGKERFIEEGGYMHLPLFQENAAAVRRAIEDGVYVIAVTARPADKHPRLWLDTWKWLENNNLNIKQLHIGGDVRIKLLTELAEKDYDVVLFDDDPEMIERSLNCGIKVVISRYPYNASIWRRNGVSFPSPGVPYIFPFGTEGTARSTSGLPAPNAKECQPIP